MKTPSGTSKTGTDMHIDKLLPGEIWTLPLPQFVELSHVEELLTSARRRFGGDIGIWLLIVTQVVTISPEARAKLREGFAEFASKNGKLVLLVSTNKNITNLFQLSVGSARTLKMEVFADVKSAQEAGRVARGAPPKPAPPTK